MSRLQRTVGAITDKLMNYFQFPEERRDVVAFGVTTIALDVVDVLGIVLAGLLIGQLGLTLLAAATFAAFRLLTGGAHFKGPWLCCIASSALLAACALLAVWLGVALAPLQHVGLTAGVALIAAAVSLSYAPVDSAARPLSQVRKVRLRRLALFFVGFWAIGAITAIFLNLSLWALASALGLFSQAITVTPGGARLFDLVEQTVNSIRLNQVQRGSR